MNRPVIRYRKVTPENRAARLLLKESPASRAAQLLAATEEQVIKLVHEGKLQIGRDGEITAESMEKWVASLPSYSHSKNENVKRIRLLPHQLYRHFDGNGELLYVGISLHFVARLSQHRVGAHWFDEIARIDVQHFATREEALNAEREVIKHERPLYNVAGIRKIGTEDDE